MYAKRWPKRLYALDVSRAGAALSVVLWHWQHFAFVKNSLPTDFDRKTQPLYMLFRIFYEKGKMGVDYFFLLSGFVFFWLYSSSIRDQTINFKTFCIQRFSRLYPLHFITLFIVTGLQLTFIAHNNASFIFPYNDPYHFILNLIFVNSWGIEHGFSFNGPVWSVSIEILLYLIFFSIIFIRMGNFTSCLIISVLSFVLWQNQHLNHGVFRGLTSFFAGGGVFYFTYFVSTKMPNVSKYIYASTFVSWILTVLSFYTLDGLFYHWLQMHC